MNPVCTICALFCGDYPDLLERCLKPLLGLDPAKFRLRLGFNAISDRSQTKLYELMQSHLKHATLVEHVVNISSNIYKYPMLRNLLNGTQPAASDPAGKSIAFTSPIGTEWMMWLDDDSGISAADPSARIDEIIKEAVAGEADMVGSIWTMTLTNDQMEWVKKQPWHNNRPISPRVAFCTGGLWLIKTSILLEHSWPPSDCIHRGGDVMLGQMMYQQKYKIKTLRDKSGLLINASMTGKECSSPHRVANFYPVGHRNANQPRPLDQP